MVVEDENLKVSFRYVEFRVRRNCETHVVIESKDMAVFVDPDVRHAISRSKCRFELSSTGDSEMDYFNDYIFLIEAAERLGKVWVFSPLDGKFIN